MARVSTYLNFPGNTEEAFEFYKTVFGTDYVAPTFRLGDGPPMEGAPPLPDHLKNKIMNAQLEILAGHVIMGTDMIEEWGHQRVVGNNTTINLEIDTRTETERIFGLLSDGASDCSPLTDMFWGAYWGTCLDRFGIRWMFNCYEPVASAD